MSVVEIVYVVGEPCEVYCHACGQLRLWCRPEVPTRCGRCDSDRIEVDVVGSDRLTVLRFGDRRETTPREEAGDETMAEDARSRTTVPAEKGEANEANTKREPMSDADYLATQERVVLLAAFARDTRAEDFRDRAELALAARPFGDPAVWAEDERRLSVMRELAAATAAYRTAALRFFEDATRLGLVAPVGKGGEG